MADLDDLLGKAYETVQIKADRPAAVKMLREAFEADPELKTAALVRQRQYIDLANSERGIQGCYVSSLLLKVLNRVFAPE